MVHTVAVASSEHIVLESPEVEPPIAASAGALRSSFTLNNRIRRVRTEIKVYEGGYLGIREHGASCDSAETRLALRHLDPRPALSSRGAAVPRRLALGSLAASAAFASLAGIGAMSAVTIPLAAGALLAALSAAVVFAHRREERVLFVTRHGRVVVVTLTANFGCFRACRALVPQIVDAIKDATKPESGDDDSLLREEVREHYRLRDGGVLSRADCIGAVQRILGRFGSGPGRHGTDAHWFPTKSR